MPERPDPSSPEHPLADRLRRSGDRSLRALVGLGPDDLDHPLLRYAVGEFPFGGTGGVAWYTADPRSLLRLDSEARRDRLRRFRRAMRSGEAWEVGMDGDFDAVFAGCAEGREGDAWMDDDVRDIYRALAEADAVHSLELRDGDELLAGIVAIGVGRALLLETQMHRRSGAGVVLLVRVLEIAAAAGMRICDVQTPSAHLERMGLETVSAEEYGVRLSEAILGEAPARTHVVRGREGV